MDKRKLYNITFTFRGERHSRTEKAYSAPSLLEKMVSLHPGATQINVAEA